MKSDTQNQIRQQVLAQLRLVSLEGHQRRSELVVAHWQARWVQLLGSDRLPSGFKVGVYRSLPTEFQSESLNLFLARAGFQLYFPRVVTQVAADQVGASSKALEWVPMPPESVVSGRGDTSFWQPGAYGIMEPSPDRVADAAPDLDLVVVPGVAFGCQGERIGRGGGFYDRCLAQVPKALRLSFVYDFQVLESLPQNPWDQSVHWIFSETSEVRTEFIEKWLQRCSKK